MFKHKEIRVLSLLQRHLERLCTSSYTERVREEERHCLLGWLAVEAGISLPVGEFNTHVLGMEGTLEFADSLQAEYDLPFQTLKDLQFANDDANDAQELTKLVRQILADPHEVEMSAA